MSNIYTKEFSVNELDFRITVNLNINNDKIIKKDTKHNIKAECINSKAFWFSYNDQVYDEDLAEKIDLYIRLAEQAHEDMNYKSECYDTLNNLEFKPVV